MDICHKCGGNLALGEGDYRPKCYNRDCREGSKNVELSEREQKFVDLEKENATLKSGRDADWRKFVSMTKDEQITELHKQWADTKQENAELKRENKIRKAWTTELSGVNLKWAKIIAKNNALLTAEER